MFFQAEKILERSNNFGNMIQNQFGEKKTVLWKFSTPKTEDCNDGQKKWATVGSKHKFGGAINLERQIISREKSSF